MIELNSPFSTLFRFYETDYHGKAWLFLTMIPSTLSPWPTQLRLRGIFDECVFRKITGKKLRISISRSFHIHQWVGRFRSCGRRKIQNTVTRWIAIFCGREKWIEKNFNFKINHDQSTAGDMYFNFATKTRRKPFLEFFLNFPKIFWTPQKMS